MATTSFRGSDGSDHDGLPAKQPEGGFSKLLSVNLDRLSSIPFSQAPIDVLINCLIYLIIASLKFSLIIFPAFTAILLVSYAAQYSIPIVDIAATASDVILYLVLVAIFFIFVPTFFVMLPAFVSRQFSKTVRNAHRTYRPFPGRYVRDLVDMVGGLTLSFGGILLLFFHIVLIWYFKEDPVLAQWVYVSVLSLSLYGTLFVLTAWVLATIFRRARQRRNRAIKLAEKRKLYFQFKENERFLITNFILSFFWILLAYVIWLFIVLDNLTTSYFVIFALFCPLIIAGYYNIIFMYLHTINHILIASLLVILMMISVWPGAPELSRKAFYLLGIGGEIPVQIALLPGNQLGLLEGIFKKSDPSGSIYGETLGPFRLILYGNERVYLSTMTDQECLPKRAGAAPANASCQRIFSIRTEYVASVDTTKSVRAGPGNSR